MEESKKLFEFHSKREVAGNVPLDELLNLTRQGILQEWLDENFYAGEARKLSEAIKDEMSDAELKLLLCKVFDLPLENLSASELEEISFIAAMKLNVHKLPDNDGKTESVETQGELVQALKNEARRIYLYGGEFRIPLNRRGVTYIGCENAVIDLDAETDVDLDASEIFLENLQVYLRHPIALKFEKSKNIKILDGSKKALTSNVSLNEILHVLRGRNAFESLENFKTRAEGIQGVAVGSTLLEDSDYNFDAAQFLFNPRWDFEYITFLKDFASGKIFAIEIQPNDAETLYNNERMLQIFADFTYRDDKLTILKLYFDTKILGRVEIISCDINSSGSSGLGGYGLKIITAYDARFEHESISHA